MALETATYVTSLVDTNPDGSDSKTTADDHIRLIKAALKRTFPGADSAISATSAQVNYLMGTSATLQEQINTKYSSANLATTANAIVATNTDLLTPAALAGQIDDTGTYGYTEFVLPGKMKIVSGRLTVSAGLNGGTLDLTEHFSNSSEVLSLVGSFKTTGFSTAANSDGVLFYKPNTSNFASWTVYCSLTYATELQFIAIGKLLT